MLKALKKHIGKKARDFKLLKRHLKQWSFSKPAKKRIVVCFNGEVSHGGLVDRLKGIISFYDIAKQLDYDFFIQFNNPFNLDEFLEPNLYNWKILDKEVEFVLGKTKLVNCINQFDYNPLQDIKSSSKSTFLVYSNIDYLSKNNKELSTIEQEILWRNHFNYLFKKTPILEQGLNKIKSNTYNSIHTRFTSLMGDFIDSTKAILTEVERTELISQLKTQIEQLKENTSEQLYVFSDSSVFLNQIKESKIAEVLEGKPFHMDNYAGGSTLEAHLKTMLDFFTIANSRHVYFLRVGKMYNSAFSKYAAIIGNKPFTKIEA
jgi:hypothetical protein